MEKNRPESKQDQPESNELVPNPTADEFFVRMNHDFRRPKPSEEAVASALQAIQRLGVDAALERDGATAMTTHAGDGCPKCGATNSGLNRFCGYCGALLQRAEKPAGQSQQPETSSTTDGQHIYHHHYHHHYFPGHGRDGAEHEGRPAESSAAAAPLGLSSRVPATGSREAAIRQLVQDWALYCNSKRLEDLVGLYSADGIVLRPNIAAAHGRAAIRQLLHMALESGLGDVELNGADTGVLGEIACLTGRSRMLAPVATGKRVEQTGKYLIVARRENGQWKILADSWSLDSAPDQPTVKTAVAPASHSPRKVT